MNIDPTPAQFAFLTFPEASTPVLNLQCAGEEIQRFELSKDQMFRLNAESADYLLRQNGLKR